MIFEKVDLENNYLNNLEISYISKDSGAYISGNNNLFPFIKLKEATKLILHKSIFGTPIFKIGETGKKIILISGVHGNELPSQVAILKLINELLNKEINETIYFVPFLSPKSTMKNFRTYNHQDLNRSAYIKGSLSYKLIETIKKLGISAVGDFHSTALKSNPGREAIFCSKNPSSESFLIAKFISNDMGSDLISFDNAGDFNYKGAIEDKCNLNNIPAITCEVLSPFGSIKNGSIERSFLQMKSFLSYFGL